MSREKKINNVEKVRVRRVLFATMILCTVVLFLFGGQLLEVLSIKPINSLKSDTVSRGVDSASTTTATTLAGDVMVRKSNKAGSGTSVNRDGVTIEYDPEMMFKQIINTSPAVLFVRSSEHDSIVLRKLLTTDYEITPELLIVDLDMHKNGVLLEQYILENKVKPSKKKNMLLQNTASIPMEKKAPYLFVNGVSLVNTNLGEDVMKLHSKNQFLTKLKAYAGENVVFHKRDLPSNS
ncbi:Pheromone-regulated membrane protein 4 [Nakaseomyces bracarensis]|uniref:Pheromone-regulated membrane protein 4 n=1 Tax=Nakaseomyces bracarensis TaxID=273131 RepID=A0ABR4NU60_9SACH